MAKVVKYIVVEDNKNPTHTRNSDNTKVRIAWTVDPKATNTVDNLAGYTQLPPTSDVVKTIKQLAYDKAIKAGVEVTLDDNTKITLAATEADQNTFTRLMVMLDATKNQLPSEAHTSFEAANQQVADAYGIVHTMTIAQLRRLIVQYGAKIASLWTQKVN